MGGFIQAAVSSGTRVAGQDVVDLVVVEGDLGGGATAWADITGKPATFAPTIGATASTAVAGNDTRLTAGAAGTATVRALGTTATTAAAGNDARLLTGTATAVNNAAVPFADLTAAATAYNTLLAALRTRGIITGS
ncbi:hypothetical protein [Streptomyces sp. BE230]|uniref:hypothetical protein n=1 Tax=Streptomyces sp. BE230 TaxID=3002526 RepID=UPI002ED5E97B|nr:hypothetical protein [Streptomyces sp. BE230]